jgi:TolA-binding protein
MRSSQALWIIALAALALSLVAAIGHLASERPQLSGEPAALPVETLSQAVERSLRALQDRVDSVEQRLARLETNRVPATAEEPDPALETRIAELERQIAELRGLLAEAPAGSAVFRSREERLAELERLKRLRLLGQLGAADREEELRLREELLRADLGALEAGSLLTDLVNDHLRASRPQEALGLLDELGRRIDLPASQLDKSYYGAYVNLGRYDEARTALGRIISSPGSNEVERVDARFWEAYSFEQQGNVKEARLYYERLLRDLGDSKDPRLRSSLDGARSRLEHLPGGK